MELTSHRVADERAAEARGRLADYLHAHGQPAELAQSCVGDRYLERSAGSAEPSEVFAEWFGELLELPIHEAEDAGWIVFLATQAVSPEQLLANFVDTDIVRRMRDASPMPRREAHLSMPQHDLSAPSISAMFAGGGRQQKRALPDPGASHIDTERAR